MCPKAKKEAPGRGEDTGMSQHFSPLPNLISQNPPDKFSGFTQEKILWLKGKEIINLCKTGGKLAPRVVSGLVSLHPVKSRLEKAHL